MPGARELPVNVWMLPDRNQDGCIKVATRDGLRPIEELIDVRELPPELVLGIPETVLRANPREGYIFGQIARLAPNRAVLCISKRAGRDRAGRTVCVAHLQVLGSCESPKLPPEVEGFPLDPETLEHAVEIQRALADLSRPELSGLRSMLRAFNNRAPYRTFASAHVPRSANPPAWTPLKKKSG